jgi:hypothetical protein
MTHDHTLDKETTKTQRNDKWLQLTAKLTITHQVLHSTLSGIVRKARYQRSTNHLDVMVNHACTQKIVHFQVKKKMLHTL